MGDSLSIYHALAAAKSAVGAVSKSQRNSIQNFNFRGIDAVVNAVAPVFNEYGIISVPRVNSHVYETVEVGAKKTLMAHAILRVEYFFYGPAGDYIMATVLAEAMDSGDKAVAKAMSVAYRTALLQVLNLPTDEKDPDESVYERSAREKTAEHVTRTAATTGVRIYQDPQELAATVHKATTREEMLGHYKTAGTNGWLKMEVAHPETGEKIALEDYITRKANDLKHSKSAGGAQGGVPGDGGAQ